MWLKNILARVLNICGNENGKKYINLKKKKQVDMTV